jgi:tol-pal system-associated acyl-CoA thioesterase
MSPFVHKVQVYYEDTDHSGVVYHANYLKYFERAREHLLGVQELVRMYREDGLGFVVYRADILYKKGARFGDSLEVRTTVRLESEFRAIFDHQIFLGQEDRPLVKGEIHLCCVDRDGRLVRFPKRVAQLIRATPVP